jgi:glutamate racemase
MNDNRPIGVFDSGLGGLTVLKALLEYFPDEEFLYLGDTARIPYGTKSPRTIARYLEQNIQFLLKQNVKAIVVACNSASTALPEVKCPVPIYGVIAPGAQLAAAATQNQIVGVIGTKATVAKKSYVSEIEKINPAIKVFQQACPLLVPLVEEGWGEDPITNLIVYRYVSPLAAAKIDTLILGCTHYPVLKNTIQKVLGASVNLIESGDALAKNIRRDFDSGKIQRREAGDAASEAGVARGAGAASSVSVAHDVRHREDALRDETRDFLHDLLPFKIMTTDWSETFQVQAQRILAPLPITKIELVEL